MIGGIGIDLVSIERIKNIYNRYPDKFLKRILNENEIKSFIERGNPVISLAGYFAAKEAVLKALGCGIGPASLKNVEIVARTGKRSSVTLHGDALQIAVKKEIHDFQVSISHEPPFACAVAVAITLYKHP